MAPGEFVVDIQASEGLDLGLIVTFPYKTYGVVKSVENGLVSQWNGENPSEKQVQVGDHIVEINGVSGPPGAMMEASKRERKMLVVRRPLNSTTESKAELPDLPSSCQSAVVPEPGTLEFTVELHASEGSTALGLSILNRNNSIFVKAIGTGLVSQWNADTAPERHVRVGDQITSINGCSGDTISMLKALKEETKILRVRRVELPMELNDSSSPISAAKSVLDPADAYFAMPRLLGNSCGRKEIPVEGKPESTSLVTVIPFSAGGLEDVAIVASSPEEWGDNTDERCCSACRVTNCRIP